MENKLPKKIQRHISKAKFKKYKKEREDAYFSYDFIIDNILAGNGGTTHWNELMINNNLSNITLVNNHRLQYENVRDIDYGKIKAPEDVVVIDLYGMKFIVPEYIQNEFGHPSCFCNLYTKDPILFALLQRGYCPPNWCEDMCPERDMCRHKAQFIEAWALAKGSVFKWHDPVLWDLPKAYNNSTTQLKGTKKKQNMIDRILTTFKGTDFFYDENIFNYLYRESKFTDWQLRTFKDFISRKIITLDQGLYELWNDFIPIIDSIYNNILMSNISDDIKTKHLKEKVQAFYECYSSKIFTKWNSRVLHLMYKHKISTKLSNPLNNFIDIIADVYKHRNDTLKCVMFGKTNEGEAHNFSYFIDQRNIIQENIKNSGVFILRSGYQYIEKLFNYVFPDITDYGVLNSTDNDPKCYFNGYWRYTKGNYPKFVIYQKDFRKPFYKLGNVCKEIIDLPTIKPQKILIIIFQKGVKELLKKFFPKELYPNLFFEYWYNIEGQNTYIDCTGVILFGCAGRPDKFNRIVGDMLNIPFWLMLNCSINGEMNQGMLRIRPNMFPNLKWCIGLTKVLPNGIIEYINFNRADDIVLVPYLQEKKIATAIEILKDVYKDEIGVTALQRKLNKLCDTELIKKERNSLREKFKYSLVKVY